jgi:hypothetical protein
VTEEVVAPLLNDDAGDADLFAVPGKFPLLNRRQVLSRMAVGQRRRASVDRLELESIRKAAFRDSHGSSNLARVTFGVPEVGTLRVETL